MEPFPAAVAATNERPIIRWRWRSVGGGPDQITSNASAVCGEASWMADGGLGHDATETTRDPISRRGSTGGGCCGTEGTRTTEEGRGGEGGLRWFILWSGCRHANQKRQLWRHGERRRSRVKTAPPNAVHRVSNQSLVVLCSSPLNSSIGVILTSAIGNISPSHRIVSLDGQLSQSLSSQEVPGIQRERATVTLCLS